MRLFRLFSLLWGSVSFLSGASCFSGLHSVKLAPRHWAAPQFLRTQPARPLWRTRLTCQQQEVEWKKVKVLESTPAAAGIQSVTIEAGEISQGYQKPGQFVQIKLGDAKPGFFAIASAPSTDGRLEFLIKETDSTKALTSAGVGSTVDMSPVMGKGFAIQENLEGYKYDFPTNNILLAATGTGIAPIRAAIESGLLETSESDVFGRSCRLYYGIQNADKMPYLEKMKEWEANGVEVVPVMSQPGSDWTGRKGYIQAAIKEDGVRIPRNTGVLLCGQQGMVQDVKELCTSAGVFDGRLLTNF